MKHKTWMLAPVLSMGLFALSSPADAQGGGGCLFRPGGGQGKQTQTPQAGCKRQARGRNRGRGMGQGRGMCQGRGVNQGRGMNQGRRMGSGRGQGRGLRPAVAPNRGSPGNVAGTRKLPADYVQRLQAAWISENEALQHYSRAQKEIGGRVYANLARAEGRHAEAIGNILKAQGLPPTLPKPTQTRGKLEAKNANARGIEIEKEVIAFYAALIKDCPDPSILPVLENIQRANHRHLRALGGIE